MYLHTALKNLKTYAKKEYEVILINEGQFFDDIEINQWWMKMIKS